MLQFLGYVKPIHFWHYDLEDIRQESLEAGDSSQDKSMKHCIKLLIIAIMFGAVVFTRLL